MKVCDKDTHTYTVPPENPEEPAPAVILEKDGPATAAANSTITYTFTATNTGNVTLEDVVLTDNKCQTTLVRVDPNKDDATLEPGPENAWHYTCTVTAPGGAATVNNEAEVCGDYVPGEGQPVEVCDTDTHTVTVPPATTPPTNNPPTNNPPVVTPPPGSGELPEEILSGRARLRGPSGCVNKAFRARVTGRAIRLRRLLRRRQAGQADQQAARARYNVKITPEQVRLRPDRVIARVRFTTESGTSTAAPAADVPPLRPAARSHRASPAEPRQQPSPTVPAAPHRGAAGNSAVPRPSGLHPPTRCERVAPETEESRGAQQGKRAAEARKRWRQG